METNTVVVENADHLHPTYETTMEALSSLITTKRRGDVQTISNKYSKLERMEMYVKVTLLTGNYNFVYFFKFGYCNNVKLTKASFGGLICMIALCMMIIVDFRSCQN